MLHWRNWFSFPSCQLQTASPLGVGFVSTPLLSAEILSRVTLCGSRACNQSEHQCCCVWKTELPWIHPPPLALTIFLCLLPHRSLSPEGRGLMKIFWKCVLQSLLLSASWHKTIAVPLLWSLPPLSFLPTPPLKLSSHSVLTLYLYMQIFLTQILLCYNCYI